MANKSKNYKAMKDELDSVLAQLQHEDTDLDKAIKLHAEGEKLLAQIEEYLKAVADDAKLEK